LPESFLVQNKMKFGISTWFFQKQPVIAALQRIKKVGFEAAEIWMEHVLKTGEDLNEIKAAAEQLDMDISLHGTSYDTNLTSINKGIRKESYKQSEEAIVMGRRINAKVVVLHPGRLSSSKGDKKEYWEMLLNSFVFIDRVAGREGVEVAIEAMEKRPREIYVMPEDLEYMLNREWQNIKLTFDIAHSYTVMEPVEYLKRLRKNWTCHVHLSDGSPETTHLPLGNGNIDIDSTLKVLNTFYNDLVIIEGYIPGNGKEVVKKNFNYLKKHGWVD